MTSRNSAGFAGFGKYLTDVLSINVNQHFEHVGQCETIFFFPPQYAILKYLIEIDYINRRINRYLYIMRKTFLCLNVSTCSPFIPCNITFVIHSRSLLFDS